VDRLILGCGIIVGQLNIVGMKIENRIKELYDLAYNI
jgi:hypothetical protein